MKVKKIFFLCTWLSAVAFAHGEDKPGPNGGYLRMPASWHTEVVPEENEFKVYLLDVSFKPITSPKVAIQAKLNDKNLACAKLAKGAVFQCKLTAGSDLKSGALVIASELDGAKSVSSYPLPLSFAPAAAPMDHSKHK